MTFVSNPYNVETPIPVSLIGYGTKHWFNTTSPTVTFASDTTWVDDTAIIVGDIVIVSWGAAANFAVATDPSMVTAGYASAHALQTIPSGSTRANFGSFYKSMGGTPDTTMTPGAIGGSQSAALAYAILRNVDPVIFDVATQVAKASGTDVSDPPSITPLSPGALILSVGYATTPLPMGTGAGLTGAIATNENNNPGSSIVMGYKLNWSSGAFDPGTYSASGNGNDSWGACAMAIKPV